MEATKKLNARKDLVIVLREGVRGAFPIKGDCFHYRRRCGLQLRAVSLSLYRRIEERLIRLAKGISKYVTELRWHDV